MPDAQFVQVFGEVSFPDEMECGKEMNIKFLVLSFFLFLYHRKKFTIDRD